MNLVLRSANCITYTEGPICCSAGLYARHTALKGGATKNGVTIFCKHRQARSGACENRVLNRAAGTAVSGTWAGWYTDCPGGGIERHTEFAKGRCGMKVSVLIVDDEKPARDELAYLLKDFPDVVIVGQGKNGVETLGLIRELNPDLVFLDVQMPGLDGFGVIKKVLDRKASPPFFVFVTAYDQYAVRAFEVNAVDYLLKPIERGRLEKAVERVRRMLEASESAFEKLGRLVHMIEERPAVQPGKLVVKSGTRLVLVDSADIIYATIQDGIISIVTKDLEGQSNFRTVEELQSNLDPKTFWRVHRSYLVNINRIKEVVPWFKSSYQLKMQDRRETEIPVSRAQTRKLRELLNL